MTRHTFSCTATSTRIDTTMANANAAPSWAVKTVVWVMNPGPIALVAIRNMAPRSAPRPAAPAPGFRDGDCVVALSSRWLPMWLAFGWGSGRETGVTPQ